MNCSKSRLIVRHILGLIFNIWFILNVILPSDIHLSSRLILDLWFILRLFYDLQIVLRHYSNLHTYTWPLNGPQSRLILWYIHHASDSKFTFQLPSDSNLYPDSCLTLALSKVGHFQETVGTPKSVCRQTLYVCIFLFLKHIIILNLILRWILNRIISFWNFKSLTHWNIIQKSSVYYWS